MKIYYNTDKSFDVVNDNGVLFHLHNDCIRVIGKVNDKWKTSGKEMKYLPKKAKRFKSIIQKATI
jgi:hypothetical protein